MDEADIYNNSLEGSNLQLCASVKAGKVTNMLGSEPSWLTELLSTIRPLRAKNIKVCKKRPGKKIPKKKK